MLYFWMVGVVSIFTLTPHNPFGIPGTREAYILLSAAYIPFFFAQKPKGYLPYFVLLIPPLAMTYSAAMAGFTFGQPFLAGVMEERRMLQLWTFFPLAVHARDFDHLMKVFLRVCIFAAIMGILNYIGVLPGWHEYEISAADGRDGRANFATNPLLIATLYSTEMMLKSKATRRDVIAVILGLTFLVVVAQTRQIVLAYMLVTTLRLAFSRGNAVLKFFTMGALSLIVVYAAFELSTDSFLVAKYAELLDLESLSDSARGSTIATIYNNLSAFGSGALSLSWRGGFSEIYGQNFFLSDVGIFATFFRFGVIFAPVILIITFLFFWAPYKKSVQTSQRVAVSVSAIALILLIPTGAIFEHKSVLLAIVVAMGYAGNMFSKRIRVRFKST